MKAKSIEVRRKRILLRKETSPTLRIIDAERRAEREIKLARENARRDIQYARENAINEAFRQIAEHEDAIKYFMKEAYGVFGRKTADLFMEWSAKEYDPIALEKKRMFDMQLYAAKIDFSARVNDVGQTVVVSKLRIPPMDWNIARAF